MSTQSLELHLRVQATQRWPCLRMAQFNALLAAAVSSLRCRYGSFLESRHDLMQASQKEARREAQVRPKKGTRYMR